ncbi:MAG: hypothetical protein GF307_03045 [candidate division Zixibacteria bacterium]|nr:hypothetical protein [candidate division Zixibacteria bacterium]
MPLGFLYIGKDLTLIAIAAGFILTTYIDLSRKYNLPGKQFFFWLVKPFLRDREYDTFSGAFYILLAGLIAGIFLDTPKAVAVMCFVILGDLVAALVGRRWGGIRLPGTTKTLEGTIGCFLVCLLVAVSVPGLPLRVGIPGAIAATAAEAYSINIDDNLAVVIASGAMMLLMSEFLV